MRAGRAFQVLLRVAMAAAGALILAGCEEDLGVTSNARAFAPIPTATLASFTAKGTTQNAPVLIRAFKKEAELEIWKQQADGRYVYVKTFPMCRWSGQLGPKVREGDRQVPEGFYTVTPGSMNPNSAYYLSFNVGYPNAYDRAWGHTGGSIMVHGICSSAGCFSMTDTQIEEIYAIMRESFAGGQHAVQMQSFPFRMTAENMAKHRLDPNIAFWRELKKGADEFEVTKMQTPVGVCNKHYVFAKAKAGASFDAEAACPPLDVDKDVLRAIADKEARDDSEVQGLIAKGVKPIRIVYQDGGQNPAFSHRFAEVSRPDAIAAAPTEIVLDDSPKAKPVAVQIAAAKRTLGDGLTAPDALVAALPPPPSLASKPNGRPQKPVVTASAKGAAKPADVTGSVPATFSAAPSAYATQEPKSATRSFFDRIMSVGASDAPAGADAAPAAAPTPKLDPGAVALAPPTKN
ncbi:MAG: L,D-transpeptidase family protein [Janthinobacterium lividum]